MRRREFITLSGGAAAALCATVTAVKAQERVKRVAILGPAEEPRFSEIAGGLKLGLRDHGHAGAALALIEGRVTRGDVSAARAHVRAAVRQDAAVLFVIGSELARAAREVAPALPIVFITPGDPVASGLVASLAHPGGNITAMTFEFPELSAKRLELLKEIAPRVRSILVLYDPRDTSSRQSLAAASATAPILGMMLLERETRSDADVARGLEALSGADALLAIPGGITTGHYPEMIRAANAKRLPTFFHTRTGGTAEALASYGASDISVARDAARLVDKILKGQKAGQLPVERPTKLQLVINLRTAKALGLTVSASLLARADEVLE